MENENQNKTPDNISGDKMTAFDRLADQKYIYEHRKKGSAEYSGREERFIFCFLITAIVLMLVTLITFMIMSGAFEKGNAGIGDTDNTTDGEEAVIGPGGTEDPIPDLKNYISTTPDDVKVLGAEELYSEYAILVDLTTMESVAQRKADYKIYPASMTKVMTLIVAVENAESLSDKFKMTNAIIDPLVRMGATRAGFLPGYDIPIKDLLYGLILPSGGDAAVALAHYISGSEEEFAKLMNKKAEALGLKSTHFTNATGLHDDNQYTTVREMAAIFAYAMNNPTCREVLSAKNYEPSVKVDTTDGVIYALWNTWDRYRDPAAVSGKATMTAAKTGYTEEAEHCLVSYIEGDNGRKYILCTANAKQLLNSDGSVKVLGRKMPFLDAKYICDQCIVNSAG